MPTQAEASDDRTHPLTVILQGWNIQYHTTQGMNTRIAAVFAFSGVVLGFLLQSSLIQRHDPFAMAGAAAFTAAVLSLLWAARTRWQRQVPPVRDLAKADAVSAAVEVERIVKSNQEKLEAKSKWLELGLVLTASGILMVGGSVLHDSYADHGASSGSRGGELKDSSHSIVVALGRKGALTGRDRATSAVNDGDRHGRVASPFKLWTRRR